MCLSGLGEVHLDGRAQRFSDETTVVLPKGSMHQLFNVGAQPLELVGIFATTHVAAYLPDGEAIELPWAS